MQVNVPMGRAALAYNRRPMETIPRELDSSAVAVVLRRLGLCGPTETPVCTALAGGVSSDIVRVDLPGRSLCVKRALPRLKVTADWRVPVERSAYEADWLRFAAQVVPAAVPRLHGYDAASGSLAMSWLDPSTHPVWKARLRDGHCDRRFAASVATTIVAIHSASAGDVSVAARFDTGALFHALRLDPYLIAAANRHPALAAPLFERVRVTATTRHALVHGDVSPKNVLVGPAGPVLLDAECAWYGDPAFDAAFCLNHLLLKCLWVPAVRDRFLDAFEAFASSYLDGADWEPRAVLAARIAALLPALLLARVDGKSPVEYLTEEGSRELVRRVAASLLQRPADTPAGVAQAWRAALPDA